MKIREFFKIKFNSGKNALDSLVSYNERLQYVKAQVYKKKEILEKNAISIHTNVQILEDHLKNASENSEEALAHAQEYLRNGDEVNARLQFKQHETAEKAKEMYSKALEKAKASKVEIDDAVSNYDVSIAEIEAKMAELKTMIHVNKVTECISDCTVPEDITDFLNKIEEDLKHETFEQKSKQEVRALTKVSNVNSTKIRAHSDAAFETFKASILSR